MRKAISELLIVMLVSGLILTGFTGCGEEDKETTQPPPLPPDSSMSMDFSVFGGGKMAPGAPVPGKNFLNAATRVLLVDAAVIITLAPSVMVFKAAKNTTPVEQEDGSWLWSYTINYLGNEFKADLTGRMQGDKTLWSMKVTCPTLKTPLNNFEWYSGECPLDNKSGKWQYYDYLTPNKANVIGTIEWSVLKATESKIAFSSTNPNSPNFGDILTYNLEGTTVTISYYDASENITADVTWDVVTTAGNIKVPGYNNGERAYWDENKQDVTPQ
jgi:hypothetical protein